MTRMAGALYGAEDVTLTVGGVMCAVGGLKCAALAVHVRAGCRCEGCGGEGAAVKGAAGRVPL